MKRCRDCGETKEKKEFTCAIPVCTNCLEIRKNVIRAWSSSRITKEQFQEYQKPGLRTKRLKKMGLNDLTVIITYIKTS